VIPPASTIRLAKNRSLIAGHKSQFKIIESNGGVPSDWKESRGYCLILTRNKNCSLIAAQVRLVPGLRASSIAHLALPESHVDVRVAGERRLIRSPLPLWRAPTRDMPEIRN